MMKCNKCICTKCRKEFGTDPGECQYSDCIWCKDEKDTITSKCTKYLDKGGTYGKGGQTCR